MTYIPYIVLFFYASGQGFLAGHAYSTDYEPAKTPEARRNALIFILTLLLFGIPVYAFIYGSLLVTRLFKKKSIHDVQSKN